MLAEKNTAMKVLIADDDPPTRVLLRAAIGQWGYETIVVADGEEAWEVLQQPNAPLLLIIDWLMPRLAGIDLCARIRSQLLFHPYIILLTQVAGTENIIKGLEAGADEFLSKPFNMAELRSRLSVGARIIQNDRTLAAQNKLLAEHVEQMKTLSTLTLETMLQAESATNTSEIHKSLEHIIAVIKNFQNNSQ